MASSYNPIAVESAWYDWWNEQGFFEPQTENSNSRSEGLFVIPAPPPNVTGNLHIGHGLTTAIQDSLVRWYVMRFSIYTCKDELTAQFRYRMRGKTTLFLPGFDHAGISTQSVVEKRLFKTTGKTRHDLGREKFLDTVLEWKNESAHSTLSM
jgi:valyl-tRNA synthetase